MYNRTADLGFLFEERIDLSSLYQTKIILYKEIKINEASDKTVYWKKCGP